MPYALQVSPHTVATVILRVQLHPPNLCRQCQFMQACNHEEKQCSNPEAKELAECNLSMGASYEYFARRSACWSAMQYAADKEGVMFRDNCTEYR